MNIIWRGLSKFSENAVVSFAFDKSLRIWNTLTLKCEYVQENIVEEGGTCIVCIVPEQVYILADDHSLYQFQIKNKSKIIFL